MTKKKVMEELEKHLVEYAENARGYVQEVFSRREAKANDTGPLLRNSSGGMHIAHIHVAKVMARELELFLEEMRERVKYNPDTTLTWLAEKYFNKLRELNDEHESDEEFSNAAFIYSAELKEDYTAALLEKIAKHAAHTYRDEYHSLVGRFMRGAGQSPLWYGEYMKQFGENQ